MFVVQSNIWVNIVFWFLFFHLDRMGIVKRLWINCAAKNSIFVDRLSAACEKTRLFGSFFCNSNKWVPRCLFSLHSLSLSLFLNTNKKLAITLYRRCHKSNSREYWKSGAEMDVDQRGWREKCGYTEKVNYSTSSQTVSWNALKILNQHKRLWRGIHLFGQKSVVMPPGPPYCGTWMHHCPSCRMGAVYILNHKIFFVHSCELKVFFFFFFFFWMPMLAVGYDACIVLNYSLFSPDIFFPLYKHHYNWILSWQHRDRAEGWEM